MTAQVHLNENLKKYHQYWSKHEYQNALVLIDGALIQYPDNLDLFWYRCCCIYKLQGHQEALNAVKVKLEKREAYLQHLEEEYEKTGDEDVFEALEAPSLVLDDILLFKRTVQEMPADICQIFLNELHDSKQLFIYNRLIELNPNADDLYCARGEYYKHNANSLDVYEDEALSEEEIEEKLNSNPDVIRDFHGMAYSKWGLKNALFNFQKAIHLNPRQERYYLCAARILHLLKRYDEALEQYDCALALVKEGDPSHAFILEQRKASEDQGRGEHHQMANMLSATFGDMKDRSIEDDAVYAVLKSMEDALRSGKGMHEALDGLVSDDPQDVMALNIARQIYDVGNEPPMEFVEVDLEDAPSYQRQHILQVGKQAQKLGFTHLANVEAPNVSAMIGQQVSLGIFCSPNSKTVISAFTMKPKWPGKLGFIILLLTGKWRKYKIVDVSSVLNNQHYINTRSSSIAENLTSGPHFHTKVVSPRTSLKELVQTHLNRVKKLNHKYPDASLISFQSLEDLEKSSQKEAKLRQKYRRSIQYVTEEELRKMLGGQYDRLADKVREKLILLAKADAP